MNIHHRWWIIWGLGMLCAIIGIATDIEIFSIIALILIGGLFAWDIARRHSR